jgi:hypothetical protein
VSSQQQEEKPFAGEPGKSGVLIHRSRTVQPSLPVTSCRDLRAAAQQRGAWVAVDAGCWHGAHQTARIRHGRPGMDGVDGALWTRASQYCGQLRSLFPVPFFLMAALVGAGTWV